MVSDASGANGNRNVDCIIYFCRCVAHCLYSNGSDGLVSDLVPKKFVKFGLAYIIICQFQRQAFVVNELIHFRLLLVRGSKVIFDGLATNVNGSAYCI